MNEIRAFIFELNGVIIYTDRLQDQAWRKIAEEIGICYDEETSLRLRGALSLMEGLEIVLEQYDGVLSQAEKDALTEEENEYYRQQIATLTPMDVPDEVRTTLQKLQERNYKLAAASASKHTRFLLSKLDLVDLFDVISDGYNITDSGSHMEVFTKAAEYLAEPPQKCVMVGNGRAGVDVAKAGGMLTAVIGDAVSCEKADYKLQAFSDILMLG